MQKCFICGVRPRFNGGSYCHDCEGRLQRHKRLAKARSPKPRAYLVYQDNVVGLFECGQNDEGVTMLKPRLLKCSSERLPKGKTFDLGTYLQGYTREQVKTLKAAVKQAVACG